MAYKAPCSGTLGLAYLDKSGTNADNAKVYVYLDNGSDTPTASDAKVGCSNAISSSTAGWNVSDGVLGGAVAQGYQYWVCTIAGTGTWNRVLNTAGTRYAYTRTGYTGAYTSPPATLTGTWSNSGGLNRDISAYVEIDSQVCNAAAPGFVSATDYHLQGASPAKAAGVNLGSGYTDFAGVSLPTPYGWPIGAYGYNSFGGGGMSFSGSIR
jgi:hypothetical protein